MSGLPREVIKWLQTLDLTYSVKNPKRDFSSGFLIGQILTRYYPNDVYIHSFDHSNQVRRKLINWQHLNRLFSKLQIPISQKEWEPVVHIAPQAAIRLINKLYQTLNKKTVTIIPKAAPILPPTYARPTVMQKLRDSELQRIEDNKTRERFSKTVMERHNQFTKLEKSEPGRLLIRSRNIRTQAEPQQDQVKEFQEEAEVEIRKVAVKTMDKNLRTAKAFAINRAADPAKENLGSLQLQIVKPVLQTMSEAVLEVLHESGFKNIRMMEFRDVEHGEELTKSFMKKLQNISPEFVGRCFSNIEKKVQIIGNSLVKSAQEFENWACLISQTIGRVKISFIQLLSLVRSVQVCGEYMVASSPCLAQQMFTDFLLLPLSEIGFNSFDKAEALAAIIFAFSKDQPEIRLRYISALLESEYNHSQLVALLSYLVTYDEEYSDSLHENYCYYAVFGLENPSPLIRTAALSVLGSLAKLNPDLVSKQIEKVVSLIQDSWWEVRAQILRLAGILLEHQSSELLQSVVNSIFHPDTSRNILRIGLVYLSKSLHENQWLWDLYLECLLSLPVEIRTGVLDTENLGVKKSVLGNSSQYYKLSGIPLDWDALAVSASLAKFVTENALQNLQEAHVDVLQACFIVPPNNKQWISVFNSLKHYLFVGLCDIEICSSCVVILKNLLTTKSIMSEILQQSKETLIRTMHLLVTSGCDRRCQDEGYAFIRSLYWDFRDPELQEFVFDALKKFADRYTETFEGSEFVEVINEIISHRRGDIFGEDSAEYFLG